MSDDQAEADIRKGERARVFMAEGIFQEAWADLDARLTDEWRNSRPGDGELREELHRKLQAMNGLRNVLEAYVANGVFARHKIDQIARDKLVAGQ